ncbi:MAG: hypothetical protein AABZ74_02590 [Cyanobacteriota bacterium]
MYVKFKLILSFLIFFLILSSCSEINTKKLQKTSSFYYNKNKVIDVGKGKIGGNIAFEINISNEFKTKSNELGWNYNSIDHYKIALVTSSGSGNNGNGSIVVNSDYSFDTSSLLLNIQLL